VVLEFSVIIFAGLLLIFIFFSCLLLFAVVVILTLIIYHFNVFSFFFSAFFTSSFLDISPDELLRLLELDGSFDLLNSFLEFLLSSSLEIQ